MQKCIKLSHHKLTNNIIKIVLLMKIPGSMIQSQYMTAGWVQSGQEVTHFTSTWLPPNIWMLMCLTCQSAPAAPKQPAWQTLIWLMDPRKILKPFFSAKVKIHKKKELSVALSVQLPPFPVTADPAVMITANSYHDFSNIVQQLQL